ncbi:MAG: F-box-like domain-containing protein [Kistimonas sp.]|nr:F-box-like domain-containing protein [Kistimonas sp.]
MTMPLHSASSAGLPGTLRTPSAELPASPPSEAAVFDRSLVLAPEQPLSLVRQRQRPIARAQTLAPELLHQIFNYLALSTQAQCALVCRHWHACLPFTRIEVTHRLHSGADAGHPHCHKNWGLAYNSRSYPLLAGTGNENLSLLQRQHEELLRLQGLQHQQRRLPSPTLPRQVQAAQHLLSALVRDALHQHIIKTQKLTLWPAVINWKAAEWPALITFSPCGRWLATGAQSQRTASCFLRIHAWQHDGWHEEKVVSRPHQPADGLLFSNSGPGVLYSVNGTRLRAWRRDESTGCWRSQWQDNAPRSYKLGTLVETAAGDLITLSLAQPGNTAWRLCFYIHADRSRQLPALVSRVYTQAHCTTINELKGHVAYCLPQQPPVRRGTRTYEIHFWHKDAQYATPQWACQVYRLGADQPRVRKLMFSPDARYLLALQVDNHICLWRLDARHRWQNALTAPVFAVDWLQVRHADLFRFRRDGKQLVVPCAAHQLQFWNEDEHGHWTAGDRIEAQPEPERLVGETVRQIRMTADGRTLLQSTDRQIDIWHHDRIQGWQRKVRHRATGDTAPRACMLGVGEEVLCCTSGDAAGTLWIHGSDPAGQLTEKARITTGAPIDHVFPCADGLTLALETSARLPFLLHLGPSTQQDAARRDLPVQDLLPQNP